MSDFFEQYGWSLIQMLSGLFSITMIFSVLSHTSLTQSQSFQQLDQTTKGAQVEYVIPVVSEGDFIVDNAYIDQYSSFNWQEYVHVQPNDTFNLLDFMYVKGEVNTDVLGEYKVEYYLQFNGHLIVKEATYYVIER